MLELKIGNVVNATKIYPGPPDPTLNRITYTVPTLSSASPILKRKLEQPPSALIYGSLNYNQVSPSSACMSTLYKILKRSKDSSSQSKLAQVTD